MNDNKADVEYVADIVSAYVANNPVAASDVPDLIIAVHGALAAARAGEIEPPVSERRPAVPVKRSVTPNAIVCSEDGRKFTSLKRHLATKYHLTPAQYRERWGLPRDYPMVAPNYAALRAQLAKSSGLGQSRRRKRGVQSERELEAEPRQASSAPAQADQDSDIPRSSEPAASMDEPEVPSAGER
ncbi:MucR family transcriptional regulator [Alsobacter sp. KACC 23698]|uniref:MucR family transcriptional regulator n=1 Tax=Alsobacter sp. KACC 23698 TaxID=3149229 RepID=A0AAU7JJI5_9HYPH